MLRTKTTQQNFVCRSRILSLIMVIGCAMLLRSQEVVNDSIRAYFDQIDALISEKNEYPGNFLDTDFLFASKERASGEEKVMLLLQLYTAYVFQSWETAKKYNDEALQLSLDLNCKKGELCANYNQAYLLFVKGDFDGAMELVEAVERVLDSEAYPETYADINTLKCDIYTERGQYDVAIELGLKLLDRAEMTQHDHMLMKANAALSHSYLRLGNFSMARNYCLRGLDYIIKLKRTEYIYPKINEIARMTAKLEGPEEALEILEFYFEIEKKIPPPGDYGRSITYMILSDIYVSLGELNRAQSYLTKALQVCFSNNYRFRIPRALVQQAELYLKTKDTTNAILTYEKSIGHAERINAFDVVKSSSAALGDLYERTNQFAKAYEYRTLHSAIRDSLFTNEREQRISILEARRRIKEVTQQKKILELKNEAQRGRYNTIATILFCLLGFSGLATFGYLKVKGKNRLLYQRTMELAKVQLEMREKLDIFQSAETKDAKNVKKERASNMHQTIDDEVKDIIMARLEKLEKEEFFIQSNCNLHQLAEQLKTNPKYLSQVINQEKKSNFNNYINGLRINYLLPKLLKDEEFRNSKLSYIAVSVGYNNLNTFNAAFKKRLGILPSYFIDQLNGESQEEGLDDLAPSI